jgi:hypothetical protein
MTEAALTTIDSTHPTKHHCPTACGAELLLAWSCSGAERVLNGC